MNTNENKFVDYYKVLQCGRDASVEELKKNYQRLVLCLHPDKLKEAENNVFLLVQKAWSILRDPVTRKQYDAELSFQEHNETLLYDTISLSEMEYNTHENAYTYDCRCGGTYILEMADSMQSPIIIGCDECSFSIQVNL